MERGGLDRRRRRRHAGRIFSPVDGQSSGSFDAPRTGRPGRGVRRRLAHDPRRQVRVQEPDDWTVGDEPNRLPGQTPPPRSSQSRCELRISLGDRSQPLRRRRDGQIADGPRRTEVEDLGGLRRTGRRDRPDRRRLRRTQGLLAKVPPASPRSPNGEPPREHVTRELGGLEPPTSWVRSAPISVPTQPSDHHVQRSATTIQLDSRGSDGPHGRRDSLELGPASSRASHGRPALSLLL